MQRDDGQNLKWKTRVSRNARYARLQIKPFGGLEVVIPPRFPRGEIPALVEKHADWAHRQLARQAELRNSIQLPRQLDLAFDNSATAVIYSGETLSFTYDLFAEPARQNIVIEGHTQRQQIHALRGWIRKRAQVLLPPLLHDLSAKTGIGFKHTSIRSQKTRWGSCSARGNISLNDQLLFAPRDTVEYLMIHELCHLRHLNHSRAFWELVATHCPGYRQHEKLLGRSRDWVPDWFLLGLYS